MSLSSSGPTAPGSSPSLMAVTTPPGYKRAGTGLIGFLSDRVVGAIVGTERRCFPSEAIPRLALPRVEGAARQRCGRPSARVRFHPAGVIGRAVRPRLLRHEGNRRGSDVRTIAIAQKEAPDAGRATPLLSGLGGGARASCTCAGLSLDLRPPVRPRARAYRYRTPARPSPAADRLTVTFRTDAPHGPIPAGA